MRNIIMTTPGKYLSLRISLCMLLVAGLFFSHTLSATTTEGKTAEKIAPSMKLSYKISNGIKTIKVEVTRKGEDGKFVPVENLIVNLYLGEVKKYDPVNGDGWMSNMVTDEDGIALFKMTDQFYKLKAKTHSFNFIASIGSDPKYEDTREELAVSDAFIKISFTKDDSLTTVVAKLSKIQDTVEAAVPETEIKLMVKRTFGALPFGEENLTTDAKGEVSGVLPADLPGNENKTITILARYEDQENDGIVEVTQDIPWNILPRENKLTERTLWSSGNNAPWPLVFVTVSLIAIIWGTISYLILLLFRIKKAR